MRNISKNGRTWVDNNRFVFQHDMTNDPEHSVKITLHREAALQLQLALGEFLAANPPKAEGVDKK